MLHKLKLLELNMLAERKEDYLLHMMEVKHTNSELFNCKLLVWFQTQIRLLLNILTIFFFQMPDDRSCYVFWASNTKKFKSRCDHGKFLLVNYRHRQP
jgi:hypothetical protein